MLLCSAFDGEEGEGEEETEESEKDRAGDDTRREHDARGKRRSRDEVDILGKEEWTRRRDEYGDHDVGR